MDYQEFGVYEASLGPVRPRKRVGKRRNLRVTPRFYVVVAVFVVLYSASAYVQGYLKIVNLGRAIVSVSAEVEALKLRNLQLQEEISRLDSDAYIEGEARGKLGLAMPGEVSYVVAIDQEVHPASSQSRP